MTAVRPKLEGLNDGRITQDVPLQPESNQGCAILVLGGVGNGEFVMLGELQPFKNDSASKNTFEVLLAASILSASSRTTLQLDRMR